MRVNVWVMKMISKPHWLDRPVDVVIVPSAPGMSGGFCTIVGDDFYEDTGEYNREELARFTDLYEAMSWILANNYTPIEFGREDGVFRHINAVERFYDRLVRKPASAVETPAKPFVPLSPVRARIIHFLAA